MLSYILISMKRTTLKSLCGLGGLFLIGANANALNILVLNCGSSTINGEAALALTEAGHSVTVTTANYWEIVTVPNLAFYDVVYFQPNANWTNITTTLEDQLVGFLQSGGGMVMCEWVVWGSYATSYYQKLKAAFPLTYNGYDGRGTLTMTKKVADPVINAGLPDTFTAPLNNMGGTYSMAQPKYFGRTFYEASDATSAMIGGYYGSGKIVNFLSTNGQGQLQDPNFRRLFKNTFQWVKSEDATGPGITGNIKIKNFAGTGWKPDKVYAVYVDKVTDQIFAVGSGTIQPNGNFSVGGPPTTGEYRVGLKIRQALRKRVNCDTRITNQNLGNIVVDGGDCDGNNLVNTDDYLILNAAFDSGVGDPTYVKDADLNGDNYVGTDDYLILNDSFDTTGD